jgi:hypothetical protein
MQFVVVGKSRFILTRTSMNDFPVEVQELLDELAQSLPPIKSIIHHIDLIPGASLQNKEAYRLMP